MTKREYLLLRWANFLRSIGLMAGLVTLVVMIRGIGQEVSETASTLYGAGIAVASGVSLTLATALSRDISEFVKDVRGVPRQSDD